MNWTEQRIILINLFLGIVIKEGKKIRGEKIILNVLKKLNYIFKKDPFLILELIIKELIPIISLEVKYRSGIVYKLPIKVKEINAVRIVMKWLLKSIKKRKEKKFQDRLLNEICDCVNGSGNTFKLKEEMYKTVLANRALMKF